MKQKIKPSPWTVLVFGVLLAAAGIVVGLDAYTGGTPTFEETLGTAALIIFFVYYLIKFIFAKRIEFDFDGFLPSRVRPTAFRRSPRLKSATSVCLYRVSVYASVPLQGSGFT